MASITTMLGELGLPWVMTSYKEKKNVRRLVQQHHKKALSTEQVWERGQMWAVLLYVTCKDIHMRNNCSEPQPRADHGSTWREQVPSRGSSATHCGEHSHTASLEGGSWGFLHPINSPGRKTESPSSNFCLDSRVPSGASKDPLRRLLVCSQVCV